MDELLFVVVIYKQSYKESMTLTSLAKGVESLGKDISLDLLVYNNSADDSEQGILHDEFTRFNIIYIHDPKNSGVSKAYNIAADKAKILGKKWLIILDQDTALPTNYLQSYKESSKQYENIPIHAPQLWQNNMLLSPCKYNFLRGASLRSIRPGICQTQNRNVLNSGLLIKVAVLHELGGYNENIPLYFSDFEFFDRYKSKYKYFIVMNLVLSHEMASNDYSTKKTAVSRFILYIKGARAAGKTSWWKSPIYAITVGLRSIVLTWRLKDKVFFYEYVKNWFLI